MGWFRSVHRKGLPAQELRALLVGRKLLQNKLLDVEGTILGILRGFGLKVGTTTKPQYAARSRDLVAGHAMLERVVEPMLRAPDALRTEFAGLHRQLLALVRGDGVCRRLMTAPGVGGGGRCDGHLGCGRSRSVHQVEDGGGTLRLTPRRYQSGETDMTGGISKVGDAMARTALFEAAQSMLTRTARLSTLKQWALEVLRRRGMRRAKVALARKLATVLHRMWVDGTEFRRGKAPAAAKA